MTPATDSDPRVQRTFDAVRAAVAKIVETEGAGAVTHQRVAEVAGVGRATIYRHWKRTDDLLLDCFANSAPLLDLDPSLPLDEAVKESFKRKVRDTSRPGEATTICELMARATYDRSASEMRDQLVARTCDMLAGHLRRAVERGELHTQPDAFTLFTQLAGPVMFRTLLLGNPPAEDEIDQVVERALAPYR